jgi:D-3-phosphoglycerate dehydrogenase
LNDETRGLMSRKRLEQLRPETILVNTSRGPVVDETALIDVLRKRGITAAALDVFAYEPLAENSPLRRLDNVVLSPHAAGYSLEAMVDLRVDMGNTAAEWIRDGWSDRVLNPEVRSKLRPRLHN